MKIPAYSLPTVEPRPAPNAFQRVEEADALAMGAGAAVGLQRAGAALQRTGDMLGEQAVKMQVVENETNVNDTYANQFAPELRKIVREYGELQGKRAVEGYAPAEQRIQKLREDVRKGMPNPAQQQMFDQISRRDIDATLDRMSAYSASQKKAWEQTTHKSVLQNFVDDASDNFNDPKRIAQMRISGLAEIEGFGQQNGMDDETIKQQKRDFTSVLYAQVVQRMALRSPGAAQAYYDQVKGEISAEAKVSLERTIRREIEHQADRAKATLAIDRQNAAQSAQDYHAALEVGAVKATDEPPKELSRANLMRLYPNDPQRVDRMLSTVDAYRRKATLREQIMSAPADEIPKILETPGAKPGEPGFRAHATVQKELEGEAKRILDARAKVFKDILKGEMATTLGLFDRQDVDLDTWNARMLTAYKALTFMGGEKAAVEAMARLAGVAELGQAAQGIRQGDAAKSPLKQSEILEKVEKIIDGIPDDDGKFRGYVQGYIGKVIQERNQGLAAAPAEFAIKYNPAVASAYEAYRDADPANRAAAAQAYAQAMESALKNYGAAPDKRNAILPESMVASITERMTTPTEQDQNMTGYVKQLASEFGPYWPRVAAQLGKQRPELLLMAEANPASAVAQDLMRVMPLKMDELKKSVPNLSESSLRTNINSALGDLRSSLPGLHADPAYDGIRAAVEKLAVYYIGQGMDTSDAVKKASSPISQSYEFKVVNGGTVRIPKQSGEPAAIERGIRGFIANLSRVDLAPDWKLHYPGMSEDQARAFKLEAVRARAVAVTVGDQIQLFLKDPKGAAAMTPLTNYGQPILADFRTLSTMGTARTPRDYAPGSVRPPWMRDYAPGASEPDWYTPRTDVDRTK